MNKRERGERRIEEKRRKGEREKEGEKWERSGREKRRERETFQRVAVRTVQFSIAIVATIEMVAFFLARL